MISKYASIHPCQIPISNNITMKAPIPLKAVYIKTKGNHRPGFIKTEGTVLLYSVATSCIFLNKTQFTNSREGRT
jgi:hypothetical protein